MMDLKKITAGTAIAGSLALAALGLGTCVANAAPPNSVSGSGWAQDRGWDHGPGWNNGGGGWHGGRQNWGPPPPPPPPYYGYGGYNNYSGGGGCVTGPFGLLHFCN